MIDFAIYTQSHNFMRTTQHRSRWIPRYVPSICALTYDALYNNAAQRRSNRIVRLVVSIIQTRKSQSVLRPESVWTPAQRFYVGNSERFRPDYRFGLVPHRFGAEHRFEIAES